MGVFTTTETMKYQTQNECLIVKVMKYFEAEVINTNADTWEKYFKET